MVKKLAASTLFLAVFLSSINCQTIGNISVNTSQVINPAATKLLGLTYDGRSSVDSDPTAGVNAIGYHDPVTGNILSGMQAIWNRIPMGGVRYPGNLVLFNWNWSYTIGPFASRIAQPMGPNGTTVQKVMFGFDEFMALCAAKGIPSSDVQIMVNIYPSVGQNNPATLAADWVEYCNAPNNGSNPRGGIDWANLRATYGHVQPYGIKIWNIGNEPWTGNEFGSTTAGANNYMAVASPIIDSMLAVDPTLKITIPLVGASSSPWNTQIMNAAAPVPLLGRIYGVSPHAFYDNDPGTGNPNPTQVLSSLSSIATTALNKGLKVVEGDHAPDAPVADPDKAMRWEGALSICDLLLGLSQISNIELANFWIYGNTLTTWHPVRKNANGTYTMMAAAQLYENLFSHFQDQSLPTGLSNASGGGPLTNSRAAAFRINDQSRISIVVVNTDANMDNEINLPVMSGYSLQQASLLHAPSINADTFMISNPSALPNGRYLSPHQSILILMYNATTLSIGQEQTLLAYRSGNAIKVSWVSSDESGCSRFDLERSPDGSNFKLIGFREGQPVAGKDQWYEILDAHPLNGINYYRVTETNCNGGRYASNVASVLFAIRELNWYPNPIGDVLHLAENDLISRIELRNLFGEVVMEWQQPGPHLDVGALPGGIYIVKVCGDDLYCTSKKAVKN